MCFSATASLVAAGSLGLAGKETLKKVKEKSDLPFASIPMIFAVQQGVEGLVWISLTNPLLNGLSGLLSFAFTMFAYVLWPIYVPITMLLMEHDRTRRRILKVLACMGFIAGTYLFYTMVSRGVTSQIIGGSISYSSYSAYPLPIFAMYFAATCLSCLVSSHKMVNLFGITLFASCFFTYQCYTSTFYSVWCFFAALLSFIVYLHFSPLNDVVRGLKERFKMA